MLNLATEKTKKPLTLFERLKLCETPSSAAVLLERTSRAGCPPSGDFCRAENCTDCWINYLNTPVDMPEKGGDE